MKNWLPIWYSATRSLAIYITGSLSFYSLLMPTNQSNIPSTEHLNSPQHWAWMEMHQAFCAKIPLLSSSIYCQSPTLVSYCSSKLSLRVLYSSAASSAERTLRWFGCPILPCYSGCIFLFLLAESYYAKDTRFGTSISDCSHCAFDCLICLFPVLPWHMVTRISHGDI